MQFVTILYQVQSVKTTAVKDWNACSNGAWIDVCHRGVHEEMVHEDLAN